MRTMISRGKRNSILIPILGICIYRILLDVVYINAINPIFGYSGFNATHNPSKYVFSWLILIFFIPMILNMYKRKSLSSIIIILLSFLSYIPFTCMVAFYSYSTGFIISNILYWLAIFGFFRIIPRIKLVRIKNDKLTQLILSIIIMVFFAVVFYISWRYTGFRVSINLLNVYDLRDEAITFKLPTILSYIYSASKAVNPVLIVYFLSRKKYYLAGSIIFIQLLSFSINGSKTVFFTTVLAVLLYWLYNDRQKNKIPWILSIIVFFGMIELYITKSFLIISFLVRRVFFVPNLLNYYYYDFFSMNTPDYFRQSFLRHFGLDSPYIPIDNLIAAIYFNRPDMGANNGLLSDAVSNFGALGILIMPLIIVITFKIFDACTEGLDIKIYIISGITLTFIFISSFFFTILLTHGFIALCLILYLLPRKSEEHLHN
ncbi:O-antigen polymerase [Sutcliffiella horikoshii]|uniref:O-antigen polymerase n=1 Tax=Sutcliffiella horikoshii TaxID=79883 RepID=UPI0038504094